MSKHITDFEEMRESLVNSPSGIKMKVQGFLQLGEQSFHNVNRRRHLKKSLSETDLSTIKEEENWRNRIISSTPIIVIGQAQFVPHGLTCPPGPQSPKLRCKARSHHILSQKEKQELEKEEISKHTFKASPIPKSVIEGPKNLPQIQKKPPTVVKPFQLTEVIKKPPPPPEPVSHFKARPVPKRILERLQCDEIVHPAPVTIPISPKFHCRRSKSLRINLKKNENETLEKPKSDQIVSPTPVTCRRAKSLRIGLNKNEKKLNKSEEDIKTLIHGPVKPERSSFDGRGETLERRDKENSKRQLEEERKLASEFNTLPLPAAVKNTTNKTTAPSASKGSKEIVKPTLKLKNLLSQLFTEKEKENKK
ncbi:targeting protein for Xklp2 homolog [Maniola hyperantus]|uniref:targeting protein for Xklp2 homolog n=1 Tax=Aphantopus hyperantus TaxID=2795564 RepID=UPI00212C0571